MKEIVCPKCKQTIADDTVKFCPKCGANIHAATENWTCKNCGKNNSACATPIIGLVISA